jgi:CBS domain-containing membrane protein
MRLKLPVTSRLRLLAAGTNAVGWTEIAVATVTAILAVLLVHVISLWSLEGHAALFVVASMGASAVLLFAVPHGSLSQPWPLFGGHLVSALVGVTCVMTIPNLAIAAALAVGLSLGAMHLLRCVHPPGGATALTAVMGGSTVYGMGYLFVLTPVLLNVMVLFAVAVLANYPFAWRRYPMALMNRVMEEHHDAGLREEDLAHAIHEMNVIVDVTAEELREIAERALLHARNGAQERVTLRLGPRFVRARQTDGWVLHKALTPHFDGHRPVETITLNLVADPLAEEPAESRSCA